MCVCGKLSGTHSANWWTMLLARIQFTSSLSNCAQSQLCMLQDPNFLLQRCEPDAAISIIAAVTLHELRTEMPPQTVLTQNKCWSIEPAIDGFKCLWKRNGWNGMIGRMSFMNNMWLYCFNQWCSTRVRQCTRVGLESIFLRTRTRVLL